MGVVVAGSLAACGRGEGSAVPTVVVIQDGAAPDARDVVSPAVLGFELGLGDAALVTRIVDVADLDVDALAGDPTVVAVMVAPFTPLGRGPAQRLADAEVPIVSLSEIAPAASDGATLRRFVPSLEVDAAAVDAEGGRGTPPCVAGDGSAWSVAVGELMPAQTTLAGDAQEVARRAAEVGCRSVVWTGAGEPATKLARALASAAPGVRLVLGARSRTAAVAETSPSEVALGGVCGCVDLSTSAEPASQRFLHDFQARTGLDAGPFAAEGYDAGSLLARLASQRATRTHLARALADVEHLTGVAGTYRWRSDGDLIRPPVRMYERVGVRWLERPSARVARRMTRA